MPRGAAREPALQQDALADREVVDRRADLDDVGDDLVAEHLRERDERGHREVGRVAVAHVHEHLLGVGAADAGEPGAQHDPVVAEQRGIGDVLQRHRRRREPVQQAPLHRAVVERLLGRREAGVDTEHECSHESGA